MVLSGIQQRILSNLNQLYKDGAISVAYGFSSKIIDWRRVFLPVSELSERVEEYTTQHSIPTLWDWLNGSSNLPRSWNSSSPLTKRPQGG